MTYSISFSIFAAIAMATNFAMAKQPCSAEQRHQITSNPYVQIIDMELKKILQEADDKMQALDKALARLNQHDMCMAQKSARGDISKTEIRKRNEKSYRKLGENLSGSTIDLPGISALVIKDVGGETKEFKGWIRAKFETTVNGKLVTVAVRKHAFSIWAPLCYAEATLEKRVLCQVGE